MAAAGGLGKNNKSPPPHSGWRLKNGNKIFSVHPFKKSHILFYTNGLVIWHGFQDTCNKYIINQQCPHVSHLIELKYFMAYPP